MTAREICLTCMGKKIIEGVWEVSADWEGNENQDQEQVCTPNNICPTCNGKGYVESED